MASGWSGPRTRPAPAPGSCAMTARRALAGAVPRLAAPPHDFAIRLGGMGQAADDIAHGRAIAPELVGEAVERAAVADGVEEHGRRPHEHGRAVYSARPGGV